MQVEVRVDPWYWSGNGHSDASAFASTANLCYTVTEVKNRASKRGFPDRFLVRDPLGMCRHLP
jgi:hypothetical protein